VSTAQRQRPSITVVIPACNPGPGLDACLASLCSQDADAEIIVVDDGSTHPIDIDPRLQRHRLRVLRLPRNTGRAAARNAGARAAVGTLLVFIDSDCVPESTRWLHAHAEAIAAGAVAATGPLRGEASGFWDHYQQQVSGRRAAQHARGSEYAGTTANMAVRADAFAQLGGFDEGYAGYGFEDRDLLLRLGRLGRIAWIAEPVRHLDALCLASIRAKFIEAGGTPARRFRERHPDAYRILGYDRIDANVHPQLRPLATLARPLSWGLAWLGDHAIAHRLMPYALGRLWVKATTALAFLIGTARGAR